VGVADPLDPEAGGRGQDGLGVAEEDQAAGGQPGGQAVQEGLGHGPVQVEEDVAAEHDLAAPRVDREPGGQVGPLDADPAAQGRVDLPQLTRRPQPVAMDGRDRGQLGGRVAAGPGPGHRGRRDVGGQHLPVGPAGGGQLRGQAVGLLAVGAAGAPDDHRALKGRQDLAAEGGELVGMAEEPGLLHGHAV